jgi:hypothetical protein
MLGRLVLRNMLVGFAAQRKYRRRNQPAETFHERIKGVVPNQGDHNGLASSADWMGLAMRPAFATRPLHARRARSRTGRTLGRGGGDENAR